jgi:DNA-binding transcriptional LysR family regulator
VLASEHPAIRVRPHEDDLRALPEGLRRGRYEFAVTYDLNLPQDIDFEALVTVPIHVIVPAKHRLAGKRKVKLVELAGEPLVLLGLPESRGHFLSVFAEAGLEPNIAYETSSFEMVRGLVANGYGYSLLHSRAPHHRALDGSALVSIPLSEPAREMHMGLARLASSRPTRMALAFAEVCRAHMSDLLAEQREQ